jgi:pimeloyl-ACP methyl ester carboxylesterase
MPKEHTLRIENHEIVSLEFNEDKPGIPIIFIQGITSSMSMWLTGQTPIIDEQFHWYLLNMPGHYPSVLPPDFEEYELSAVTIARVLAKAIKELVGDSAVILAGHSTGGFAALDIAANAADIVNIERVICVSGFAEGRWRGNLGVFQRMARIGELGEELFKVALRSLGSNQWFYRLVLKGYLVDRRYFYSHPLAGRTLGASYADAMNFDIRTMLYYFKRMPKVNIRRELRDIDVPVLVVTGDKDPIVTSKQAYLIASRITKSQLAIVRGAGHLPMNERPERYHQIITDWLSKDKK